MKPHVFRTALALAIGTAFLLTASAETRKWNSANGEKTFEGDLLSYSSTTGMVKVKRTDGRSLAFTQSILSTDDIESLKTQGDVVGKSETSTSSSSSGTSVAAKEVPDTLPRPDGKEADMTKPVQVFIMMGQSNMVGLGNSGPESKNGSLAFYCKTEKKYPYLIDDGGNWTVRKDVRCSMVTCDQQTGWLEPGFGAKDNIGPELGFGHVVGHALDAPVLLIKACIGNRSLGWDLLPPGSKAYDHGGSLQPGYGETPSTAGSGQKHQGGEWYAGKQYDDDTANAKAALADLATHYPGATKYEVAGFVFWQGEKDGGSAAHAERYEQNLVQFIQQLRKDFDAPKAKFVLATLGEATKGSGGNGGKILEAHLAVDGKDGKHPEFKGNVATVYSNPLSNGGSGNGHYGGNAGTYMNVGEAMGKAMVELLQGK